MIATGALTVIAVFDLGCADVAGPAASPSSTALIDQASLPRVALDAGQSRCNERGDPVDPPDSAKMPDEALEFLASSEMEMIIEVVNTRKEPIRLATPASPAYRITLFRPGANLPMTRHGDYMHPGLAVRDSIQIAPGASFERRVTLKGSTTDQIRPGQYRLKVEYFSVTPQNATRLRLKAWVNVIIHE